MSERKLANHGNVEEEKKIAIPILRTLQDNGGELSRDQITDFLISNNIVTEDDVNFTRVSKKTGNEWRPYSFIFNYALKNLKVAGYVDYMRNKPVVLTVKGLACDVDSMSVDKDVYEISAEYWRKKKEARTKKNILDDDEPVEDGQDGDDDKDKILQKVKSLDPKKFESFCRGLLKKMGIEIDPEKGIQYSNDGGIDGFGYCVDKQSLKTTRVAIQCKRWENAIGSNDINALRGAVDTHRAEYGVFITTSYFSRSAVKSSREGGTPITLIDGQKLVDLMIDYEYKVRQIPTYIPDEEYFGD